MPAVIERVVRWVVRPVESVFLQLPRALVVSVLAAGLDTGTLALLREVAGWNVLLAATVSYLLGGVLQYVLCSVWVFGRSPGNLPLSFVVFTVLSLGGLVITIATIEVLRDYLGVHYMLAKVAALGLAFVWNFVSRKYLLFRPRAGGQLYPEAESVP